MAAICRFCVNRMIEKEKYVDSITMAKSLTLSKICFSHNAQNKCELCVVSICVEECKYLRRIIIPNEMKENPVKRLLKFILYFYSILVFKEFNSKSAHNESSVFLIYFCLLLFLIRRPWALCWTLQLNIMFVRFRYTMNIFFILRVRNTLHYMCFVRTKNDLISISPKTLSEKHIIYSHYIWKVHLCEWFTLTN